LGELREDEELAQLQTGDDRTAAEVRYRFIQSLNVESG
jgi:hypothetical protein